MRVTGARSSVGRVSLVAVLVHSTVHLQRLRSAVRDRHELVICADWSELRRACAEQPIRSVIVDVFAGGGGGGAGNGTVANVRQLRLHRPKLAVIVYSAAAADRIPTFFELARAGADSLVLQDQGDAPGALFDAIERAERRALAATLRSAVATVADPIVRQALVLAVARAPLRLTSASLARFLSVPRPVLRDRLQAAGFPPPRRLIMWGRLITAADQLEDPRSAANRIASALGFPSGSAFRNVCQRYLHATPRQIRERGGAAWVLKAFVRQIQEKTARGDRDHRRGRSLEVVF